MEESNMPNAGAPQPKPASRPFIMPEKLPESESIMLMGILSIVTGCVGIVLAFIALQKVPAAKAMYNREPERYSLESYKKVKTGETCAWVGLVMQLGSVVFLIIYFIFVMAMSAGGRF